MLFFFLSRFPLVSQSQQSVEITADSTLQDLLAAAALNNPGLKSAFHQWKAALEKVPQVRALPNPQLTFAYFIREIETRVGPQKQKVGIMQMFPWFGKLKLRGSAAAEAANATKQRCETIKLTLFYRVKEVYYDYYYAMQTISVLEENVQLLEYLEEVILAKYKTAATPYSNLVRVQVELDKLQDRLKTAKERLRPLEARLNAALNRPLDAPLPHPKEIPTGTPQLSNDQLADLLKEHNPALKAIDSTATKAQIGIKLAKKNYYPDFSLGVDYMLTGKTGMPGVLDSGKDPIAAMMSLRLPIWSKKNKASVNEAKARHRAVLNRRKNSENKLLTRLEMVFFKYNDAKRKMILYRDSLLPRAQQALEVTRSAFEAGKADFMDYIDSQRILLAFELEFERAKTQQVQRLAELEMLVGSELSKK
jgi:outer membrane protein TolC